jgi:hypothetical protein
MTSRGPSARSHFPIVSFVNGPPLAGAIFDTSAAVALLAAIVLALTVVLPQPATCMPAVSTAAGVARSYNSTARTALSPRAIARNYSSHGTMVSTQNVRHKTPTSFSSASRHQLRHGHHHGRSALGHRESGSAHVSHHHYAIARPGACAAVESVYDDCFLCGKVANEIRIYRGCCNGDAEIVRFCNRLLS